MSRLAISGFLSVSLLFLLACLIAGAHARAQALAAKGAQPPAGVAPLPGAPLPEGVPELELSQVRFAPQRSASVEALAKADSDTPARLIIPRIGVDSKIVGVGVNAKGEMDVPPGSTSNVGWYKFGTAPGRLGSAVIDAHVFAAFKELAKLEAGGDIYVQTASGAKLHFKVQESKVYALASVPLQTLFNRADDRRLNLITCAGDYIPSLGTYDHRLIVYATLVA